VLDLDSWTGYVKLAAMVGDAFKVIEYGQAEYIWLRKKFL